MSGFPLIVIAPLALQFLELQPPVDLPLAYIYARMFVVPKKALFNGRLVFDRAKEIRDEILKLGITAG